MDEIRETYSDSMIRPALRDRVLSYEDNGSILIEELGICQGQVRVDLVSVNGLIHGYEIKSDLDSLDRLRGQVALYSKVLDKATLVVSERHLADACSIVPEWWGVHLWFQNSSVVSFIATRPSKDNPAKDVRALVELIWREEALDLLVKRNIARGYRDKTRDVIWDKVCEVYSLDEVSAIVRSLLKSRAKNRVSL